MKLYIIQLLNEKALDFSDLIKTSFTSEKKAEWIVNNIMCEIEAEDVKSDNDINDIVNALLVRAMAAMFPKNKVSISLIRELMKLK